MVLNDKVSYFIENQDNLSEEDLKELSDILIEANEIYSNGGDDTGLSDSEYDELVSLYEDKSGKILPIGAKVTSGNKVAARYLTLRGTLAKVYSLTPDDITLNKSQKTIDDWLTKIRNIYKEKTGKTLDTNKLQVQVVPKYDGVSVVCEYTKEGKLIRAITRGDTTNNESKDITHVIENVKGMAKGPFTNAEYEYGVKYEVMVSNDDLDECGVTMIGKSYKNTRAAASSILNSEELPHKLNETAAMLYLKPIQLRYSYLIDGVESPQYMSGDMYNHYLMSDLSPEGLKEIRSWALKHGTVPPGLRCDGAVICILDEEVRKVLGRTNDKQNYEVAYKFTAEYGFSKVKSIEFSLGNFGNITPIVNFKKVNLKGNDVKRAAISYYDFLKYKLAEGDEIKVTYDIIPYITVDSMLTRSGNKRILPPEVCPECGFRLIESDSGRRLYCDNPDCVCRVKGKILNYVNKMGIENISYETISDFYDEGFLKTIDDLYKLEDKAKKIAKLPGYGVTSIAKIVKSINDTKVVVPSRFLGSIGIDGISTKKFHDILQHISYDELLDSGYNKEIYALTGIPGFKEKTSTKTIEGIYDNRKLIEKLENYLTILDEPQDEGTTFTACFTKVRDDELEDWITLNGGIVNNSSVTKDTSFVVVPNMNVTSSKTDKAIRLNIPIIMIEDVKDYVRRSFIHANGT